MIRPSVVRERPEDLAATGIVGGIIGAILMGMVSMILFVILGIGGFFQPMNLIGAVFNQSWGTIAGFALAPSILGIIVHMMMAAIIGIIFVLILSRIGFAAPLIKAIVWALIVWVVAEFVVLPFVDPVLVRLFPAWLFAVAHICYGIGLGGYVASRERIPAI